MSRFFGIDTSNYRTSAALFDSETMQWKNSGRLLEVPEGHASEGTVKGFAVFRREVRHDGNT